VVLRVVSLLEVQRLTLVPHLPSGDQTPAHIFSVAQSLIVVPLRLLSEAAYNCIVDGVSYIKIVVLILDVVMFDAVHVNGQ
jgi:hypothetical protein